MVPAHDKGHLGLVVIVVGVFVHRLHVGVRDAVGELQGLLPLRLGHGSLVARVEGLVVVIALLLLGTLDDGGEPVSHGVEIGKLLRLLLCLVHLPGECGDLRLKIRALDDDAAVFLGEPFDVERIPPLDGRLPALLHAALPLLVTGGDVLHLSRDGDIADDAVLDGLEIALVLLAARLGIDEGDAGAGHIPPGIALEVEGERLLPALEPDAATHAALLGVVEFAANDCLIESECHVRQPSRCPRENSKANLWRHGRSSVGCFTKSSFPNLMLPLLSPPCDPHTHVSQSLVRHSPEHPGRLLLV